MYVNSVNPRNENQNIFWNILSHHFRSLFLTRLALASVLGPFVQNNDVIRTVLRNLESSTRTKKKGTAFYDSVPSARVTRLALASAVLGPFGVQFTLYPPRCIDARSGATGVPVRICDASLITTSRDLPNLSYDWDLWKHLEVFRSEGLLNLLSLLL